MKRWRFLLIVAFGLAGCGTVQHFPGSVSTPVVPKKGEKIAVDQAILIVDSSSSMRTAKIKIARQLAQSFIDAMPHGNYKAGLIAFGGDKMIISELQTFQRIELEQKAKAIPYIGGKTPLEESLEKARELVGVSTGKTAVIILSDGLPTSPEAALEAARQLAHHPSSNICIHTVWIGDDEQGRGFLDELAQLTSCGSSRKGETVYDGQDMKDFVRYVFLDLIPDSDNDGVLDPDDACPDTPRGAKVDERGCWTIPGVLFELDQDVIRPQYHPHLNGVAQVLKDNPELRIHIDGHACSRGTEEHNQDLSFRRATAVKQYLIDRGIKEWRMVRRGFGESKPLYPNDSEENMAKNRRVEFTVIK